MELRTPEKHLAQRAKSFSCSPLSNRVIAPSPKARGDVLRDYRDGFSCHLAYNQRLVPAMSSSVTPAFAIMSSI